MQVSRSRSHSGARRAEAARGSGRGPSPVDEWLERLVALFDTDRHRAAQTLQRDLRFDGGPTYPPEELFAAFRREVESGRLRSSPEAHVELARALAARGDPKGAHDRLLEGCRLVADRAATDDPTDRRRASEVNYEASLLFHEMRDRYQGEARYAVSRFYSRLPNQRWPGDLIPRVQGNAANTQPGPVMHAPWPHLEPPSRLKRPRGRDAEPNAPPAMEGPPVPAMQGIELLNTLSAWVGVCRDLNEMAGYLDRCERIYVDRNFLRAPIKPAAVEELKRRVTAGLEDPDPKVRASAWRLYGAIDFNLLGDCSRAYWGRTQ